MTDRLIQCVMCGILYLARKSPSECSTCAERKKDAWK